MKRYTDKLDRLESAVKPGTDVARQLVAHRYAPACFYNRAQLQKLSTAPGLDGRVARGLLRIRRADDDAKVIKFDAEAVLVRTMASFYAAPRNFPLFAFEWGSDASTRLVPLPAEYRDLFDCEFGPDKWALDFLTDLGTEIERRPFDRINAVPAVRMAIASGHAIGKTTLQSWLMLWAMATRDHCRGICTSVTSTQLATRLWPEMLAWLRRSIVSHWFDSLNAKGSMRLFKVEHPLSWRFDAQTAAPENAEAFAGLHNATSSTVFLVDEGSGVDNRITTAIEGSMVDGAPLLIACGNPTRRDGAFYSWFHEQSAYWNVRHIDSRTAHLTNKQQIETWREQWGEDSDFFKVRVRGLFPSRSISQFIASDVVASAREIIVAEPTREQIVVVGADPARFGSDASALATRFGRNARTWPIQLFRGLDTFSFALRIAEHVNMLRSMGFSQVLICVDGVGVGAGVVDSLRSMGFSVIDVQAAGKATDERKHANRRAELNDRLREWLIAGGAIEDDDDLAADLTAADYLFDTKGRLLIESKDSLRSRLGRSPDRSDALALTFAVTPAERPMDDRTRLFMEEYNARERAKAFNYDPYEQRREQSGIRREYDPYANIR